MIHQQPPIIIPVQVERTRSPAEEAAHEAINRYDNLGQREAFSAGARWERGEDSDIEWPLGWIATIILLYLFVNAVAFLCGMLTSDCRRREVFSNKTFRYEYEGYKNCEAGGKWDYIFPAYSAAGFFKVWMKEPIGGETNKGER